MNFNCIACEKEHVSPFNTIYKYQAFMNTCSIECWRVTKLALLTLEEKELTENNYKTKMMNSRVIIEIDKAYNIHTMQTRRKTSEEK